MEESKIFSKDYEMNMFQLIFYFFIQIKCFLPNITATSHQFFKEEYPKD